MPRGTETENNPEVPQEGKETSPESMEINEESRRTEEATTDTEILVERDMSSDELLNREPDRTAGHQRPNW